MCIYYFLWFSALTDFLSANTNGLRNKGSTLNQKAPHKIVCLPTQEKNLRK